MRISIIMSAIFIPVIVTIIFSMLNKSDVQMKKTMTDKQFVVEIPNTVLIIGIILDAMCVAIILGFTFLTPEYPHIIFYITFGLGIWLGTYLELKTLNFKVYVQDKKITIQNIFRKQATFTFNEIVLVKRQVKKNQVNSERMIVETNSGHKMIVESTEISYKRFMKRVKEEVDSEFLVGFEQ